MSAPVTRGTVIKGKYRIDRVLGEGGMGVVVAAHHLALDRRVAIKFLHRDMLAHPEVVERFAREARAASRLESDHVARVMDVDALDDGTPFMVMEHLEGSDLSSVREGGRGLPVVVAIGYLLEACEAVAEAHRLGIVHRDLKPANLFLARRSDGRTRIKLLDFGISKLATNESKPGVTKATAVMGSCEYMSPEQMLASKDVDARTDIWALGVTLFELLTARVPFPGETLASVCAQVMAVPAGPPSAHRADLPEELDRVVLRCLEKNREHRYASVEELAAALAPFAEASAGPASVGARVALESQPPSVAARSGVGPQGTLVASMPPEAGRGGTIAVVSRDVGPPLARGPSPRSRSLAFGATAVAVLALAGVLLAFRGGVGAPAVASAPPSSVSAAAAVAAAPAPNVAEVRAGPTAVPVITLATIPEPTPSASGTASAAASSSAALVQAKGTAAPARSKAPAPTTPAAVGSASAAPPKPPAPALHQLE